MKLKIKFLLVFTLVIAAKCCFAVTPCEAPPDSLPKFHLQGDSCVIDFLPKQQYIFIEGSIGFVKGKFMFDTGSPKALTINSLFVKLPGGIKAGTGFNGSGEHYDILRLDTVRDIAIDGGYVFPAVGPVGTNEEKGIQNGLMPDFLGLIGYDFFKGYVFKLDYAHHKLTFYKSTSEFVGQKRYLNGEKLVATLNFEKRKAPNHPLVSVKINGIPFEGEFDTGQPGTFYPTDSTKKILQKNKIFSVPDQNGESKLSGLELATGLRVDLKYLHVRPHDTGNGIRKAIGIEEENFMGLGYGFLSQFITVWDYDNQKIYLLAKQN